MKQLKLACIAAACLAPTAGRAQIVSRLDLGARPEVGGEAERYLRVLQIAGITPLTNWTIQPFSNRQSSIVIPTSPNPWQSRFINPNSRFQPLRPKLRLIGNSAFPFQPSDGATWAGKGLTAEVQAGIAATFGHVHFQFAPLAFVAQNAAFPLAPNTLTGDGMYRDARFPGSIDLPQRFGAGSYHRVDLGNTSLDVEFRRVVFGLSNAPQRWGPGREYSLVLSPNGGGFPRVYAGTGESVNLWLVHLNARWLFGQLRQSGFYSDPLNADTRYASALVVSMEPRGAPGLEIGATRFFQGPWSKTPSLYQLRRPFTGLITTGDSGLNESTENQVASVFFRWALPKAGTEFYGELYREDYPGTFRWFLEKPDDLVSYMLGFQRVLASDASHIRVLRGEIVNGELSHQERGQRGVAGPVPPYTHAGATQGHTVNGLLLGAPDAYGGAGWRVGIDDFTPNGRRSISFERSLRLDWLAGRPDTASHPDVLYAVRFDITRFRGAREYGITVIPMIDLNRNLQAHNDIASISAAFTLRGWR